MADGPSEPEPAEKPTETAGLVRGGFVRNVLPALAWAVALFVAGGPAMPQPSIDLIFIPIDKVDHLLAFCGMQVLGFRALRYELPGHSRPALLWSAAVISLLFGIALELYQFGLPDRSAEVADAIADGLGAAIAAIVLGFVRWP